MSRGSLVFSCGFSYFSQNSRKSFACKGLRRGGQPLGADPLAVSYCLLFVLLRQDSPYL